MPIEITRRDFINGAVIGTGGLMLTGCGKEVATGAPVTAEAPAVFSPPDSSAYYPPIQTGMRGSHEGSFEVAHELAWRGNKPAHYETLNEHYDLIVVGAGMSGLAAAHYYQQKMGNDARILILDNHDDFGGHAKRNEFHQNGRMMLSLGGAQNIEALSNYSDAARGLMQDIGIDDDFIEFMNQQTPDNMFLAGKMQAENGVAMPGANGHVTVRGNWLAAMFGGKDYEKSVRALPLPTAEQDKLIDFFAGHQDFLDDLSLSEKWDYINANSYNRYLVDKVGLAEDTVPVLNVLIMHLTGVSGWNLTVLEGMTMGGTGIKSMGWVGKASAKLAEWVLDSLLSVTMFPDGNASVARLLVQKLIPAAAPGMQGTQDVAIAHFNYSALDQQDHPTRLRLNSTVVGVRDNNNNQVEVDYVQQGKARRVTADHCVLACYNALIPHLCPEMPEAQKEGTELRGKNTFRIRQCAAEQWSGVF
jgi:spermidine dehydrogenase